MVKKPKYQGSRFNPNANKTDNSSVVQIDTEKVDKLITIQAGQLKATYNTECLDAKQLKDVLNVGENNVYEWLNNCPHIRVIGRRKVVPIIWIAHYLVTGKIA